MKGKSEVIKQMERAMERLEKVRFLDSWPGKNEKWILPKHISLCDHDCNAGSDCVHKFVRLRIPFCMY